MGHASPARDRTGAPLRWTRLSGLSLGLGLVFGPSAVFAQSSGEAASSNSQSLKPVQVEAERHTPLAIDEPSHTGSRLGLTPLETPASIEVLTGDTIRARGDVSVIDAATRATGITGTPGPGNGGTAMVARGFRPRLGDAARSTARASTRARAPSPSRSTPGPSTASRCCAARPR